MKSQWSSGWAVGLAGVDIPGRRRIVAGLVLAVACSLGLLGCADRPTAGELQQSILRAAENDPTVALTEEQARCIADRLLDTSLSDTTLEGLTNNFDEPQVLAAERDRVEPAVADAAASCVLPE